MVVSFSTAPDCCVLFMLHTLPLTPMSGVPHLRGHPLIHPILSCSMGNFPTHMNMNVNMNLNVVVNSGVPVLRSVWRAVLCVLCARRDASKCVSRRCDSLGFGMWSRKNVAVSLERGSSLCGRPLAAGYAWGVSSWTVPALGARTIRVQGILKSAVCPLLKRNIVPATPFGWCVCSVRGVEWGNRAPNK